MRMQRVRDRYIEKVEACRIHDHQNVLWSGHWLGCVMDEGKFRGMLPVVDHIGSHSGSCSTGGAYHRPVSQQGNRMVLMQMHDLVANLMVKLCVM